MPNTIRPGLGALIHPCSPAEFFAGHWPEEPLLVEMAEQTRSLRELPLLSSLENLLDSWPLSVQAHLPDRADEVSAVHATPTDARKLFQNKMSLLFNHAEKISPILREWLAALQTDLGLPAMSYGRCMIYATPAGGGTAAHFDQNINFVLQIHGEKKWWLAPNQNVIHPTQRHTAGCEPDAELASYARLPFPEAGPLAQMEDAFSVTLNPGSLLFVPRGYWHSTEAGSEAEGALALNFTFNQPTWIDLFTAALRSRLSLSGDWRELADGVSSTQSERRQLAEEKLDTLLLELAEDIPNWRVGDILQATEGF